MSPKKRICRKCPGLCCRYVTIKISPPRRRCDRDEHRWLLMHDDIELRIEDRKWYMQVRTDCGNLTRKNQCRIYADRPDVCEDYHADGCDFNGDDHAIRFATVKEYDRYLEKRGMPWRHRARD